MMGKQFNTCEYCGAALDSGEKCDCKAEGRRHQQEVARAIMTLCDADKRNRLIKKYGWAIGEMITIQEAYAYIKK